MNIKQNTEVELLDMISIEQHNFKILCNIKEITSKANRINSVYLFKDGKVVARERGHVVSPEFMVFVSGIYQLKVLYFDLNNEPCSITKEFTVALDGVVLPTHSEISAKIDIEQINNKLMCDVKAVKDDIKKIHSYYLYHGNKVISRHRTSELQHFFSILESGELTVKIFYESINSEQFCIERTINVQRVDLLHQKKINNPSVQTKQNKLLFQIIYAFIIREFQRKYDKGYFRYFSIILGPGVQLGIMVAIFTSMGRKSVLGLSIPLFVLTGIIPYGFFSSAGNCLSIISGNMALLSYKQVKIIDTIIACVLMELLVNVTVFIGAVAICWYLGMSVVIYNPLSLISAFMLLFFLTLGLAMVLAVVGFYFAEFSYAIQVIFRALFYISGVFFSIESIPVQFQKYLLWNPLLQIIELIRFSFVGFQIPNELSYTYLVKSTVFMLTLGIALYFVNRHKFLINDRARV